MKKLLVLIICLGLLAVTGCTSDTQQSADNSKNASDTILKIGLMPDIDSIPFIIAEEKGFFKEEGVNVELQHFKSAMDRDSALQSGNLDGGVSDMLAAGFAKDGGFDVKMTSMTDGNYCLVAGTANNVQSIKNMKGQNISVSKNTIIEFVLDQMLMENQMTEADINKTVIPQIPTRLEMLQNGKLDAAVLPEPMGSIAIKNGCHLINSSEKMQINPGVMVFINDSLQNKSEEIKAMYRAYNKAVEYLNNTPQEEYMDLVIEKAGLPPATKDALTMQKYHEAALPSKDAWEKSIQWLNQKGLVKETYSYDDMVSDILSK
ncbi:ABC transporter substrate-binding protein [Megamonas hypermegale]|uniref:ABC transporter substrate-binding protein n=1 Tax=Megamonas hypermegale TaxID=158847 RepID=UPI00195A29DF|nr:MetQ/NlpA family ABC transporter substrate-binding protein [Megamonas hypermegale]MBM6761907.1 ABC transporter substrate-binding protein [Megamonas hypermegale]